MEYNIKPEELRIGNWVQKKDTEKVKIAAIDSFVGGIVEYFVPLTDNVKSNNQLRIQSNNVYPAELNERWLLDFNFSKKDFYWEHQDFYGLKLFLQSDPVKANMYLNDYYLLSINYVHELQNIFYYLTKKELQLNN